MPKYYVMSGTLEKTQDALNAKDAMIKALIRAVNNEEDIELGVIFSANEIGFDLPCCQCDIVQCATCESRTEDGGCLLEKCMYCEDCDYDTPTDEVVYSYTPEILEKAGLTEHFGPMEDIEAIIKQTIEDSEEES